MGQGKQDRIIDDIKNIFEKIKNKIIELWENIKFKIQFYKKILLDLYHKEIFFCNPRKNITCKKSSCYIYNDGGCRLTKNKNYRGSRMLQRYNKIIYCRDGK